MYDNVTVQNHDHDSILDVNSARTRRANLDRPPKLPLTEAVKAAAQETGSGTSWLPGFWRASSGPGKLTAAEYFYYRLYAGQRSDDDLARFVGKEMQTKMHVACNDVRWFAPSCDKLFFLSAMLGAGVPVPETLAVFDPSGRRFHPKLVTSEDAVVALLDRPESYPIFAKPIDGMYSVGTLAMTDGGNGTVHLRGAGTVATGEVARYMKEMGPEGYLLQRTMTPHETLADAFGGTLASVRFLVLVGGDGPKIESAVIKIPTGENIADNYWRSGNLLGAVDPVEGRLVRVVTGVGPDMREVEAHPDTGQALLGLKVPEWRAARAMCERAAGTLPGLRTQSWDIALTQKGPVALEVNWGGDLNLHQLAWNRGALTPAFVRHLQANGYKGKLPV